MRKVPETRLFQELGSFDTSRSKLSHGTSSKFADVRPHLRKVFKSALSSILNNIGKSQSYFFLFISSIQKQKLLNSLHRMDVCFDYFQQGAQDDLRSGDRMEVHWC